MYLSNSRFDILQFSSSIQKQQLTARPGDAASFLNDKSSKLPNSKIFNSSIQPTGCVRPAAAA
jgi:hypothetical protein